MSTEPNLVFGALGTNLAAKFLRAHGITLLKVRDENAKLLEKAEADMFSITPERPPMTDEAQRALDWAVDQKIKSGLFFFIFLIYCCSSPIAEEWKAACKTYDFMH